jgi:hypothetical protein
MTPRTSAPSTPHQNPATYSPNPIAPLIQDTMRRRKALTISEISPSVRI